MKPTHKVELEDSLLVVALVVLELISELLRLLLEVLDEVFELVLRNVSKLSICRHSGRVTLRSCKLF